MQKYSGPGVLKKKKVELSKASILTLAKPKPAVRDSCGGQREPPFTNTRGRVLPFVYNSTGYTWSPQVQTLTTWKRVPRCVCALEAVLRRREQTWLAFEFYVAHVRS